MLAVGVETGWWTAFDQWGVDWLAASVTGHRQSRSDWSSVLPIFRPDQHHAHLAVAAVTYVVAVPASLALAGLLTGLSLLVLYRVRRLRLQAVMLGAAFVLVNLAELAGKALITRQPLTVHEPSIPLHTFDNTFPSGHAMRAVVRAVAASAVVPRLRPILFAWVVAVAVSLVVGGAHTLTDTLGGLLLATCICLVALNRFAPVSFPGPARWTRRSPRHSR